jgi:predicted XRE-type DNA-binding protein
MARQNIFLDLGFPKHEAAVMLMRADLATEIRQWLKRRHLSQVEAAAILGISAPRLNEIVKNRVEKVSVDYLLGLCAKAKIAVSITLAA